MSHATRVGIQTFDGRSIPSTEEIAARDHEQRHGKAPPHILDGIPEVSYALCTQVEWAGETPIKATKDGNGYPRLNAGFERLLMGTDRDLSARPMRLWLRTSEVAALLEVSESTVQNHIDAGRLVSNRPTNHHRIPITAFIAFCRTCGYDDEQVNGFATAIRTLLATPPPLRDVAD